MYHAAHQTSDVVSANGELAIYAAPASLFLLWAYAVQAAYYLIAFAADFMTHTGVRPAAVTYLRDIVFATMAFPATAVGVMQPTCTSSHPDAVANATVT